MTQKKPVCAVVGVGPGNGEAIARRFSADGYVVALMARQRRADNHACRRAWRSESLYVRCRRRRIRHGRFCGDAGRRGGSGGSCLQCGFGCVGHGRTSFGGRLRAQLAGQRAWAFHRLARSDSGHAAGGQGLDHRHRRDRLPSGRGWSAAAFAPAKMAQRGLAESMARHLWPAGIHVALIIVDGIGRPAGRPRAFCRPAGGRLRLACWRGGRRGVARRAGSLCLELRG